MYSYIRPLKLFVLSFERSIWISHAGERNVLCYVPGERGVKEESGTKSTQELKLMKAVLAAEVQKLWKGFGCSMNR